GSSLEPKLKRRRTSTKATHQELAKSEEIKRPAAETSLPATSSKTSTTEESDDSSSSEGSSSSSEGRSLRRKLVRTARIKVQALESLQSNKAEYLEAKLALLKVLILEMKGRDSRLALEKVGMYDAIRACLEDGAMDKTDSLWQLGTEVARTALMLLLQISFSKQELVDSQIPKRLVELKRARSSLQPMITQIVVRAREESQRRSDGSASAKVASPEGLGKKDGDEEMNPNQGQEEETDMPKWEPMDEELSPGAEVIIEGSLMNPQLNGLHGTVALFERDRQRYHVNVTLDGYPVVAKMRRSYLRAVGPAPPPEPSSSDGAGMEQEEDLDAEAEAALMRLRAKADEAPTEPAENPPPADSTEGAAEAPAADTPQPAPSAEPESEPASEERVPPRDPASAPPPEPQLAPETPPPGWPLTGADDPPEPPPVPKPCLDEKEASSQPEPEAVPSDPAEAPLEDGLQDPGFEVAPFPELSDPPQDDEVTVLADGHQEQELAKWTSAHQAWAAERHRPPMTVPRKLPSGGYVGL
ncbi:zmpB, partial [Symbiodinium sp. CCMP2592]